MKIPLFPLKSIYYPGETVPLHIFEERYKRLIHDCKNEAVTFGIPVYFETGMLYGTEVQLVDIVTEYEGGEMDVACVARQVFRLKSFERQMSDKLYAGGEVEFLEDIWDAGQERRFLFYTKNQRLYTLMEVDFPDVSLDKFNSYAFAHKMGLSFLQEYELLQMGKESIRLDFIETHLDNAIEVLAQMEHTKERIQLNGHFRSFDPLDFSNQ